MRAAFDHEAAVDLFGEPLTAGREATTPDASAPTDRASEHFGFAPGIAPFAPTRAAAIARVNAIDPELYSRTRNRLDGAVSGLSPYLTHGLVSSAETLSRLIVRRPLTWRDRLVMELLWREFFQHVFTRLGASAILRDIEPTPPWPGEYARSLPADIREGRTGVPAIDTAVRALYTTGWLHNHARLWLASYCIHVRKVWWRAGADWLYAHLVDGDLASNHLSWQWVAGTFSAKPYLFNAENVARFAPPDASPQAKWRSPRTVIDRDYDAMEVLARTSGDTGPEPGLHDGVAEPALHAAPQAGWMEGRSFIVAGDAPWRNRALELVHPWAIRRAGEADAFHLGVIHAPGHGAAFPAWTERRWRFVLAAMADTCDALWIGDLGDAAALDFATAARATSTDCVMPGYQAALAARLPEADRRTGRDWPPEPRETCRSFSRYYKLVQRESKDRPLALTLTS